MSGVPRRGVLLLGLVLAFCALGAPRWLDRGAPPAARGGDGLARVCGAHGGTPAGTVCTVRYGERTYRMDAVTPTGFDADAASFNRRGCEAAGEVPGARRFVFHADTGVCESQAAE